MFQFWQKQSKNILNWAHELENVQTATPEFYYENDEFYIQTQNISFKLICKSHYNDWISANRLPMHAYPVREVLHGIDFDLDLVSLIFTRT